MIEPYYSDDAVTLYFGDCVEVLKTLPDASVDSVVTDPPYGIAFMGKHWDTHVDGKKFQAWCEIWATECLRVLKPGGHIVAFGGSRMWHRLASAIEDSGFEIRDSIAWLYSSGFPKSLDVSKAIDKAAGVEREVVAIAGSDGAIRQPRVMAPGGGVTEAVQTVTAPATDAAKQWEGFGTALRPSHEPIVLGRKPLIGTVVENVLTHGTGAINIDGCRVGMSTDERSVVDNRSGAGHTTKGWGTIGNRDEGERYTSNPAGRWPANVLLDESMAAELDAQSGVSVSTSGGVAGWQDKYVGGTYKPIERTGHDDSGGASRFFPVFKYVAKAPQTERPREGDLSHATVKPLSLMRWLVRLVTPPGGIVLEPFAGSGTTAEACVLESMKCIAIEREADYLSLIKQRLAKPLQRGLFGYEDS